MRKQHAFTLVELLVVIGIIVLLIALAIPNLARARSTAKRTVCLTHVREISRSLSLYVPDWNSPLPYLWLTNEPNNSSSTSVWTIPLTSYGNIAKARQCPEALGSAINPSFGTSIAPWTEYCLDGGVAGTYTGGYAINGWLIGDTVTVTTNKPDEDTNLTDSDDTGMLFGDVTVASMPLGGRILNWERSATDVPTFADGIWSEARPSPTDPAPSNLQTGSWSATDQMGRVCIVRHGKTVNVAFFDGHAENIALQKLWTLNWKPGWKAPNPLPKLP
jgi:prepilin-type processing-associated H-X9-DG protein/prepilin-type N-terminal cleavage/methylation domain-containing protein